MAFDLKNKVVLITGGSHGIGAKVIEFLLNENVKHVANLDIAESAGIAQQNTLNEKYGPNKLKYYNCDVSNEDQLLGSYQAVLDEQKYIDVVINNAGIMNDSKEKYKKQIEINVIALTTSTLKAMEIMSKEDGGKGGVVVNISSIAALSQNEYFPIYFGTKSAVLQFSNCIGFPKYFTRTGVRVVTICFGMTDTALLTEDMMGGLDRDIVNTVLDVVKESVTQKADSAAKGLIEVIKRGASGSTWLSINDEPVQDITDTVKKAYAVLTDALKDD